jgi:hypothetical protein
MEMEVDFYMSKSEKKAGPGEGKNGKKKWIIVGVAVVLVLAAAVGGNKGSDQTAGTPSSEPPTQASAPAESEPSAAEPEPNTSAKVDALAREAKDSVAEGVTEEMRDEAVAFIVEHYPDYYGDNETMEQAMFYGFWLEYAYDGDEAARGYYNLGMDMEQAVKYVYRGAEKAEDEATKENLAQIKESLEAIGQTVE